MRAWGLGCRGIGFRGFWVLTSPSLPARLKQRSHLGSSRCKASLSEAP